MSMEALQSSWYRPDFRAMDLTGKALWLHLTTRAQPPDRRLTIPIAVLAAELNLPSDLYRKRLFQHLIPHLTESNANDLGKIVLDEQHVIFTRPVVFLPHPPENRRPVTVSFSPKEEKADKLPPCPHQEILALWGEILPAIAQPTPTLWAGTRERDLCARWRQGLTTKRRDGTGTWYTDKESGLRWWRGFFTRISKNNFLMEHCTGFQREGIGWTLKQSNFRKILENKFS